MDRYLGTRLKHWAAREKPPRDGLARLLWSASIQRPHGSLTRIDSFRRWLLTDSRGNFDLNFAGSFLFQPRVSYLQLNFISVC
jgi:hypothetical protein